MVEDLVLDGDHSQDANFPLTNFKHRKTCGALSFLSMSSNLFWTNLQQFVMTVFWSRLVYIEVASDCLKRIGATSFEDTLAL